jgi:predicted Zn-dependent protease
MGRIEYWLLGAVAALIGFVAIESVRGAPSASYSLQIEQAGHPRGDGSAASASSADSSDTANDHTRGIDMHGAVLTSRRPAPARNVADVRRRIADGAQSTYILDLLESQDSVLYRWPDSRGELHVWIQSEAHIPDWWVGYVQSARDVFLEWQTSGVPLRFDFPADSTGADIVVRWIDQFPSDEMRIGKTHRMYDQNAWVTHAEVVVALHDRDGDRFPPGEISEILRHEIGHALGLGHSRNRATIMYPENTQLDLTEMDKETLHLLYQLPPGKVK